MAFALVIMAALVTLIDQLSKTLALHRLERRSLVSNSRLHIRPILNPGYWPGPGRWPLLAVWGWAVLSAILLIRYGPFLHSWPAQVGLGAALGGALSNLLDRFRYGAVVDFIDLRAWSVFNLADVAIIGGLGLALWFFY